LPAPVARLTIFLRSGLGQALADDARTYTPLNSVDVADAADPPQGSQGRHNSCDSAAERLRASIGDADYKLVLAGAKLIGGLHYVNSSRVCIERGSVYGAVILIPQLARTLKYPRLLTASSVKVFGFLLLCLCVHAGLLTLLSREEVVIDAFAGQPYLCNFGLYCSDEMSCTGPGGTVVTPDRLYSYDEWTTRNFVKQSIKAIFPDRAEDIDRVVDPGEYGAETFFGRLLCCFIFITALDPELDLALNLARLLRHCPTNDDPWLALKEDNSAGPHSRQWWLEHVTVMVGGMPMRWKIFNYIFILFPRMTLYTLTCTIGVNFLMETAVVDDVIINACALGFLLSLDNMILESFTNAEVKFLMEKCEDLPLEHIMEEDETVHMFHFEEKIGTYWYSMVSSLMPWKLLRVVALTSICVLRYYHAHCTQDAGNSSWHLVSKTLYTPVDDKYSFWNTFSVLFPLELNPKPRWEMPE